jgi:hypothetical protein
MIDTLEKSLAELRVELSPTSADKARLRGRIVARALTGGAPTPPLSRWGALKAAGSVGVVTGALLLGAGVGVGFWLGRETIAPSASRLGATASTPRAAPVPPDPSVLPDPVPLGKPAPVLIPNSEPALDIEGAARDEPRRNPARPRATRKALAPNPWNDELALLRRVERALRNGAPELALALLRELDERFPDTRLMEERQAARLMAGCRLNDRAAIARGRAFLHDNPASVYRQRVQLACESGTASAPPQPDRAPMKPTVSPGH